MNYKQFVKDWSFHIHNPKKKFDIILMKTLEIADLV